jgi:Skp family chaperone for outer membrane proteins
MALVPDWPYVDQGLAAATGAAASSTNAATTIGAVNSERRYMTSSRLRPL